MLGTELGSFVRAEHAVGHCPTPSEDLKLKVRVGTFCGLRAHLTSSAQSQASEFGVAISPMPFPAPKTSHVRESSRMAGGIEVSGRARESIQSNAILVVHFPHLISRGRGWDSWTIEEIKRQRVGSWPISYKEERGTGFLSPELGGRWRHAGAY